MSAPNVYDIGDQVTLTGLFFSDAAKTTPADTTVVLSIRDPNRAITTPTATHGGTGIYTYQFTPALAGLYEINWQGTGAVVSAEQQAIFVRVGVNAGSDLTTLDSVKAQLKKTDANDDAILQMLITAASVEITNYCQRQFTADAGNPRSHRFKVTSNLIDLAPFDLQSATTITMNPQDSTAQVLVVWTDYTLLPLDGSNLGTYYQLKLSPSLSVASGSVFQSFGFTPIDILGTWGAPSIPAPVSKACDITVATWFRADVAAFSTVFNADTGIVSRPRELPDVACAMLGAYRRVSL